MNSFQKQIPNTKSKRQDLDSISNVDEANDACSAVTLAIWPKTAASNCYKSRMAKVEHPRLQCLQK